jgi:hypothetical protein
VAVYRSSPLANRVNRTEQLPAHKVYLGPDEGPFRCDHCSWFAAPGHCSEPHIILLASRDLFGLKLQGRVAIVDPGGCSDFYEKKGK